MRLYGRLVHGVDESFLALPAAALADAALTRAIELGAEHADFRLERIRTATVPCATGRSRPTPTEKTWACRSGSSMTGWGFAAGVARTTDDAARLADDAVATAARSPAVSTETVVLAPEPVHADAIWVSDYDVDPFTVARAERIGLLTDPRPPCSPPGVDHVEAVCLQVRENRPSTPTSRAR